MRSTDHASMKLKITSFELAALYEFKISCTFQFTKGKYTLLLGSKGNPSFKKGFRVIFFFFLLRSQNAVVTAHACTCAVENEYVVENDAMSDLVLCVEV